MNTITYSVGNNSVVVDQTPKIRCQFNPKLFGYGLVVGFDQKEIFENGTGIYPVFVKNHQATIGVGGSERIFFSGEWADEIRDAGPIEYVVHVVGENNYKRDVYVFDIPGKINLRAGLTIHSSPGTWSSWPMHTFEERAIMSPANSYPDFEEVFAFITDPVGGWGLQTVRSKKTVDHRAVCDHEIVGIPLSFHPVVGAPDVRMGYFWAYTNGGEKFTKDGRV